ncbi:hypothetical protein Anas_11095 [Armadillidium nasatum]|uniref:Uncharacterized protein n=1 Tax=Armadillidium nasatum TaxID=96803 RepID=A0A5N5TAQ2_9CRUS|nr:hypothetical protein Anas_11095 [Armadillidium nasatum]
MPDRMGWRNMRRMQASSRLCERILYKASRM